MEKESEKELKKEVEMEESTDALTTAEAKQVVHESVEDSELSAMIVDETTVPDLSIEADNTKPLNTRDLMKPEPMQTDEEDFPEPPVLEKQVEDIKPPVLELQQSIVLDPKSI